jgi:hypothetical protein
VTPICTIARRRCGSFCRVSIIFALASPSETNWDIRIFLREIIASSAQEKNPFKKTSSTITSNSSNTVSNQVPFSELTSVMITGNRSLSKKSIQGVVSPITFLMLKS